MKELDIHLKNPENKINPNKIEGKKTYGEVDSVSEIGRTDVVEGNK